MLLKGVSSTQLLLYTSNCWHESKLLSIPARINTLSSFMLNNSLTQKTKAWGGSSNVCNTVRTTLYKKILQAGSWLRLLADLDLLASRQLRECCRKGSSYVAEMKRTYRRRWKKTMFPLSLSFFFLSPHPSAYPTQRKNKC